MKRFIPIILALSLTGCSMTPLRCMMGNSVEEQVISAAKEQVERTTTPDPNEGWEVDEYQAALVKAKETNTPIFVDFTGHTCTNCRWMEKNIFARADVQELMSKYILVRLYTDRNNESNKRNRQMQINRFRTIDLPFYAIFSPDDKVLAQSVFSRDAEEFKAFLHSGLEGNESEIR